VQGCVPVLKKIGHGHATLHVHVSINFSEYLS
jgi:hypothetical protein